MAEVQIIIGGRDFNVVCPDGEETYLQSLAAMLDKEVRAQDQKGLHMTESRLLLMAGLMLADRLASLERGDGERNSFSDAQAQTQADSESLAVDTAVSKARDEGKAALEVAEGEIKVLRGEVARLKEELATASASSGEAGVAVQEATAAKDALREIVNRLSAVNDER